MTVIDYLLHLANSDPPFCGKREFYALKDRLLQQYGTLLGEDVQHIRDMCWTCEGTGIYRMRIHEADFVAGTQTTRVVKEERCRKCSGTGVYSDRLVLLRRYRLGRYEFHIPQRQVFGAGWNVTIEGRVAHRDYGRWANEAALWLTLLTDWPLFRLLMTSSRMAYPALFPMLRVQAVVFELRMWWGSRLKRKGPCYTCGRHWRLDWRNRRLMYFQCPKCDSRLRVIEPEAREVPF